MPTDIQISSVEELQTPDMPSVRDMLLSPIDERHLKTRVQGNIELTYYPCWVLNRCLLQRAPNGFKWEILEVSTLGDFVFVRGRLTIYDEEGVEMVAENVASERLDTKGAPPIETAASSCFRRAAANHGLGIEAYLGH